MTQRKKDDVDIRGRRALGLLIAGIVVALLFGRLLERPKFGLTQTKLSVVAMQCGPDRQPPARPPTQLRARVIDGDVDVKLTHYWFFCSPTPTFSLIEGMGRVVLTADVQGEPKRDCVCPYNAHLWIHGLSRGKHKIQVDLNVEGARQFASADVVIP